MLYEIFKILSKRNIIKDTNNYWSNEVEEDMEEEYLRKYRGRSRSRSKSKSKSKTNYT